VKAKKISLIILILIIFAAVVHVTVSAVMIYNNYPFTSFPWSFAFVLPGFYYYPLIIISFAVFVVFSVKEKKLSSQK